MKKVNIEIVRNEAGEMTDTLVINCDEDVEVTIADWHNDACVESVYYHNGFHHAINMNQHIEKLKLIPEWCRCNYNDDRYIIFKDDNECECGTIKHHYHCARCGRVNQVG